MQVTIDARPANEAEKVQQSVTFTIRFLPESLAKIIPCEDQSPEANRLHRRLFGGCPLEELEKLDLAVEMARRLYGLPPDQTDATVERLGELTGRFDTSERRLRDETEQPAASSSGDNG